MLKKFLFLPLLLTFSFAFSQSLKPISQMVANAKAFQSFERHGLFNKQTVDVAERPELNAEVQNWTLLAWDAAKIQRVRNAENAPLSIELPWENNTVITLDLVPARNFSPEFQVHTASSNGAAVEVDKGVHFWGIVKGNPNSLATISVFENEVIGMIEVDGARYTLGALASSQEKTHVLYKDSDLKLLGEFNCFTDEQLHKIGEANGEQLASDRSGPDNCVRMYVETDYTLFQNKGSVANVVTYMNGVFSQVSALYTNESVNVVLHDLVVWDVADPYTGPTASDYLVQFRNAKNGTYNGDLAHLVGINGLGGVAYLDVLCNNYWGIGYSSINSTFSNVPTYSWTIEVLTHEIGHNLGSPHTHACAWNGNNTAIDGCGPAAGYSEGCNASLPSSGTIMSYCHLVSGVGINFNNGFGPQPGDRIRSEVYNAACLAACGGGGCSYTSINSNNFESGLGIWTDGGADCIRTNNATYANSPTYSILLRDNTTTSIMSTNNQNYSNYDELTIDFSYITVSFETGEDFWVQISTNGGSTYTTKGDFNAGTQFTNGVRKAGQVIIPGPFTANTRLRFRADASDDDDQVYIDDVAISGCLKNGVIGDNTDDRNFQGLEESAEPSISNFQAGPNPATDNLNIQFDADGIMEANMAITDLSGRVIWQKTVNTDMGFNRLSVPLGHLSNGLYLLRAKAGDESIVVKIVLAK
jgi:hypothetical protein